MLAIAGGKGGCGKTTTTLGLAVALARQRTSVLTVDADRDMPNLHRLAGVARSPGLGDVRDASLDAVARDAPSHPGVSVVPSASATREADVATALGRLRSHRGPLLVDCPAGAGRAAVEPLRAANRVLLVTTLDPACLRDTAKTAAMAREIGTPVVGVAATKVAPGVETRAVERAARLLDCPALAAVPRVAAGSGRAVLSDPGVEASYARLAAAVRVPNT